MRRCRNVRDVAAHPVFDLPLLVDRAAHRREDVELAALNAVVVRRGSVLAAHGAPVLVSPYAQPKAHLRVFLGSASALGDVAALVPHDQVSDAELERASGAKLTPLRDLLRDFAARGPDSATDQELATTAVAIAMWHELHPRCSLCGVPTEPHEGGWVRRCPDDGKSHYPRTDPAIIVAITDPHDRLLLAHAAAWSPLRFSLLAGYVEPGESLEQAVHREVQEEVGLVLTELEYDGSQSWPFPGSVMVGFRARTQQAHFTLDEVEITEALWVTREELAAHIADGNIVIAPHGSIARRLIEQWYGGALG